MLYFKKYLPLLIIALLYAIIALTQLPILENIWRYSFDDGTYSHAYLIPIISIYLYWILFKEGLLLFNEKINVPIFIVAILTAYALFTFTLAQFPFGYRITLILFLTSTIAIIFKPSFKVLFPSLFLVFLLPIWGVLTAVLQHISTEAVTIIMSYTSIPTYVEGNLISIPQGVFEIAGGCSGLRYLLVSLSISSLFIFLNIKKASHGSTFLFIAITGALITNWLRITGLILIGYYTNMESSLMEDHNSFGWYLYIPFMVSLFYFGERFIAKSEPLKDTHKQEKYSTNATVILVPILLIIANFYFTSSAIISADIESNTKCDEFPASVPTPQLHSQHYICVNKNKEEYIITYSFQAKELDESVDFYLNEFTPQHWEIINRSKSEQWNFLHVQKGSLDYSVSYAFQSSIKKTPSLSKFKQLKLLNALQGESGSKLIWKVRKIQ